MHAKIFMEMGNGGMGNVDNLKVNERNRASENSPFIAKNAFPKSISILSASSHPHWQFLEIRAKRLAHG